MLKWYIVALTISLILNQILSIGLVKIISNLNARIEKSIIFSGKNFTGSTHSFKSITFKTVFVKFTFANHVKWWTIHSYLGLNPRHCPWIEIFAKLLHLNLLKWGQEFKKHGHTAEWDLDFSPQVSHVLHLISLQAFECRPYVLLELTGLHFLNKFQCIFHPLSFGLDSSKLNLKLS